MNRSDITQVLAQCELFSDFTESAIQTIANYYQPLAGATGDLLYNEGDLSTGMYVIASGRCTIQLTDDNNRTRRIGLLRTGQSIGELSILLRGERLVSVAAASDVLLLELSLDDFRRLKREHPDVCLLLIMSIVKRFGRVLDGSRDLLKRMLLRLIAGLDEA